MSPADSRPRFMSLPMKLFFTAVTGHPPLSASFSPSPAATPPSAPGPRRSSFARAMHSAVLSLAIAIVLSILTLNERYISPPKIFSRGLTSSRPVSSNAVCDDVTKTRSLGSTTPLSVVRGLSPYMTDENMSNAARETKSANATFLLSVTSYPATSDLPTK